MGNNSVAVLTPVEKRASYALALIFAFRMLGLFMIIPVFSLYAHDLKGASPLLIGIAMGCYGLTQALLQIPFGMWSDKLGRKPIILTGLLLFALGSLIAALSHSIWGVIAGRSLQGAGAVGSTIIALLADLTREETRTKAMAIIGITIGAAFAIGMILGPLLNALIHVSGIFALTAVLALGGIFILYYFIPAPEKMLVHPDAETIPANLPAVLRNKELWRLNIGIFLSHAILTATFVALPVSLQSHAGLLAKQQWLLYLPVLLIAFACLPRLLKLAEGHYSQKIFLFSIASLGVAELLFLLWQSSVLGTGIALWLFFTAFTLLEAMLPANVSKAAPQQSKGTAVGVYSTCQFFGIFVGGCLGGWVYGRFSVNAVLVICIALTAVWICVSAKSKIDKKPLRT